MLTENEINIIVNPALDRIGAGTITAAVQTSNDGVVVNRHYEQTRDALLRSFLWPFAAARTTLIAIQTLTLDSVPVDGPDEAPWEEGDTITGETSGATGTILSVQSGTEYDVGYLVGEFEDGETVSNGTSECACGAGFPEVEISQPSFKWEYQYALPTDFLRLIDVYQDDKTGYPEDRFTREGWRLLTHYDAMDIQYVRKITDPTQFDELFVELFILRLAQKILNPLAGTASEGFRAELREELRTAEYKARCVAEQENNTTGRFNLALSRYGVYG